MVSFLALPSPVGIACSNLSLAPPNPDTPRLQQLRKGIDQGSTERTLSPGSFAALTIPSQEDAVWVRAPGREGATC